MTKSDVNKMILAQIKETREEKPEVTCKYTPDESGWCDVCEGDGVHAETPIEPCAMRAANSISSSSWASPSARMS